MNDEFLLALLKSDPEKGLAEALRQYSAYVYKIAYTKLCDVCTKEDIEEAVSDIFLKFFQSGSELSFELKTVRGFISVIAARHCTDLFRKHCKDESMLALSDLENILSEESITDAHFLLEAVKSLGEPDSSIFIRKYYFGQRNKDIAKELGLRQSAVNTRISRGLVKLRKILKEDM